jgi:hypothetical protein
VHQSSSFDSPFKGAGATARVPSFAAYRNKKNEMGPKVFSYFMVGTMGALSAVGAKATVQGENCPKWSGGAARGRLWVDAGWKRVLECNWRVTG